MTRDDTLPGGGSTRHGDMRRSNLRLILQTIIEQPGHSNADLARFSGLTPPTVSGILSFLEGEGLVSRGEILKGRRGQPATPFFLNAAGAVALGIEISWYHADLVAVDLAGKVLASRQIAYDVPNPNEIIAWLATSIPALRKDLTAEQSARIRLVGVAIPFELWRNALVFAADKPQADAWRQLDLQRTLKDITGLPVHIVNDGHAACLAEMAVCPDPNHSYLVYLFLADFIGSSLVANGQLWVTPQGNSAVIGTVRVRNRDGEQYNLDMIASGYGLLKHLKRGGSQITPRGMTGLDFNAIGNVGDEWSEEAASAVAEALVAIGGVVGCRLVVIDGVFPQSVLRRIIESVRRDALSIWPMVNDAPEVVLGNLGRFAPAIGAALSSLRSDILEFK